MKFRSYTLADKAACLTVFDSNTPKFFAEHERDDFSQFLDAPGGSYFVVEHENGVVIGCGGYWGYADGRVALTWGMVAQSHHRHGIGRWLLLKRLAQLCSAREFEIVTIETSQHSCGFFEKIGFQINEIRENGFAPGLHLVSMRFPLDATTCERIAHMLAKNE